VANNNADFGCTFTIKNADRSAYDLTAAVLEMSVKNTTGAAAAATFSTSGGSPALVIRSPATAGIVDLYVPFTAMETLKAGLYFWDLLQIVSGSSHVFLGGGTWQITQGITESDTPSMPVPLPYVPTSGSDIKLTRAADSISLTLTAGGPPGTLASFVPQTTPPAPTSGFVIFCDIADSWLKAISSSGKVTELAPPS
jgi:hypothetical protein